MTESPQPAAAQAAGLLCPACRVSLVMSDRQGIEIDYCPRCRGVWLDRGELDKIIERSAAYASGPAPFPPTAGATVPPQSDYAPPPGQSGFPAYREQPRYGGHGGGGHGDGRHGGRRGSFLSNLFD